MVSRDANDGKSTSRGPALTPLIHGVRIAAGIGLVLYCVGLRPGSSDPSASVASAPGAQQTDATETDSSATDGRVALAHGVARGALAGAEGGSACSADACSRADGSGVYGAFTASTTAPPASSQETVASLGLSSAGQFGAGAGVGTSSAATGAGGLAGPATPGSVGYEGRASGATAPGSARGSDFGDKQTLAPVLLALNQPDARPGVPNAGMNPLSGLPDTASAAPIAMQSDPNTPASDLIGATPLSTANPLDRRERPMNRGSETLIGPDGRPSLSNVQSVLPTVSPAALAMTPGLGLPSMNDAGGLPLTQGLPSTWASTVPGIAGQGQGLPAAAAVADAIDRLVAAAPGSGMGPSPDNSSLPSAGSSPVDQLFNGPDGTADSIADAALSPTGPTSSPYIQPVSDLAALAPSAVLAAVVSEPATGALLALAAWGLAATRGSRRGSRHSMQP